MVGIVTHVAALAERVPVRFVVSHSGATSALREERA
jgi:DNA repair exonuclease SbcCD ATPase subunit